MTKYTLTTTLRKFCSSRKIPSSTVFALSSGQGKCGVAVIRVSGPSSGVVLKALGGFRDVPTPRKAYLRKIRDPHTKDIIDKGIVIWFPGEFTKRAFYSGKIDLTEVEGLADLLNAETEFQRKQAYLQMEGALTATYAQWKEHLLQCLAHVEAYIDFNEDDNIEEDVLVQVNTKLDSLRESIKRHLVDGRKGETLRRGVRTVILGEPNVGKSSLLNSLTMKETAIVSSLPGTTRDVVSSTLDLGGFPLVISDTAGLRHSTSDPIEAEGMARARTLSGRSDLILLLVDSLSLIQWLGSNTSCQNDIKYNFLKFLTWYSKNLKIYEIVGSSLNFSEHFEQISSEQKCLVVLNKSDLVSNSLIDDICNVFDGSVCKSSCIEERGLECFLKHLTFMLKSICGNPTREDPCLTQARHRHCIEKCLTSIENYFEKKDRQIDLAAQDLRDAFYNLGKITGHTSPEEVLDVIFKDFCIGK